MLVAALLKFLEIEKPMLLLAQDEGYQTEDSVLTGISRHFLG